MRRAVALCGGGTKGAYELGVWKAIRQLEIDYHIVTGTSIGAINGALLVSGDFELAEELWDTIRLEDVMLDGVNLDNTIEGMYNQREALRPFLKNYMKNKGADISPFLEFIDRMVDENKVRNSDVDYGLVTVQASTLKALELTKEEIPQGKLKDFIMASASIFPIFPMHKIDGETYLDGCYYDNLPIDLALKMGADDVITVDLHTSPVHPNYVNKPYVTYIKPSRSLGTMLNFDRKVLDDNIRLGYQDAMKAFGWMIGSKYSFSVEELGKYEEQVLSYASKVARTESYLTEGTFNRFVKPGDGKRLCGTIEEEIGKRLSYTREEYFIAGAEICGHVFGIDSRKPWRIKEFIRELLGKLKKDESCISTGVFEGKSGVELAHRLAELKLRWDSAAIVRCMYYGYKEGRIDLTQQLGFLTFLPFELAAVLFLLTVD